MTRYILRPIPCPNSGQREAPFDRFMKILHEFVHAVALGGAARNGGDFGPEASLLRLMHYNLDLHYLSPHRIVARTPSEFKSSNGWLAYSAACPFTSADTWRMARAS